VIHRPLNILAPCTSQDILARPWLYEIDPHHPLAQGLAYCVTLGGNLAWSFTTKLPSTPINTNVTFGASTFGPCLHFSSADNTKISFGTFSPVVTSNGAGTGDFTVGAVSNSPASAAVGYELGGQRITSGGFGQFRLIANRNKAGTLVSGTFAFFTFGNPTPAVSGADASGVVDGNQHAWVGRRLSTAHSIWVDGVDATTSSDTTVRDILESGQTFALGGLPAQVSASSANGDMPIACGWDYALPDELIREWSLDPFCMFRPKLAFSVGVAAAAGVALRRNAILNGLGTSGPFFNNPLG